MQDTAFHLLSSGAPTDEDYSRNGPQYAFKDD